ncbi:MAG: lipopolysaccharide biosynthesis protein [Opitutaceae bacterium]|nr:lipopolysaccharide biosynthesis protein [Opitutaceae bacterium]
MSDSLIIQPDAKRAEAGSGDTVGWKRFLSGAGAMQLNKLANAGISALQLALIARFLTPHDYGIYGVAFSTLVTIQSVLDVRCTELVIKYFFEIRDRRGERAANAFLFLGSVVEAGLAIGVASCLMAFSVPFASLLLEDRAQYSLFVVTALVPLSNIGSGISGALISLDRSYGKLAVSDTLATGIGFLILACVITVYPSPMTVLVLSFVSQLLRTVVRWYLLWRSKSPALIRLKQGWWDWQGIVLLAPEKKLMLRNAWRNNTFSILKVLQGTIPTLLMARMQSPAEAAAFFLGQRVASRLGVLVAPITDVAFRESAEGRLGRGSGETAKQLAKVTFIVAAFVAPALLLFCVFGQWSVPFIFGESYRPDVDVVRWVVGTVSLALLMNPLGSLLILEDRVQWLNAGFFCGFVAQVFLLLLLVPDHGALGASWSLAAFYSVVMAAHVFAGLKLFKGARP